LIKRIFSIFMMITLLIGILPKVSYGATVGSVKYHSAEWDGKDWLIADICTSADGQTESASYVNEDGNLVVRSIDGINVRGMAKYPDSTKADGSPNDFDPDNVLQYLDEKEFDVHFRMKFTNQVTFMVRCLHTAVRLWFRDEGSVRYDDGKSNYHTAELQTDGKWHDYTVSVRGQNCGRIRPKHCLAHVRLYMDGKEILSFCTEQYYPAAYRSVMFYADYSYSFASMAEVAYCRIEDKHTSTQILSPYSGFAVPYGDNITVTADAGATGDEEKEVEFFVDGIKVANGVDTASSNATAVLSGLKPGTYSLIAVSEGVESADISLSVSQEINPTVDVGGDYNSGDSVTLRTYGIDNIDASKVEYYMDGNLVASSMAGGVFRSRFLAKSVGSHSVWAKIYASDGKIYESEISQLNVGAGLAENYDFGMEYRIDYTLGGGSGSVCIDDGFFNLNIIHRDGNVFYTDRDGTQKQYDGKLGDGKYRIVATSGNAEIYYNGQFAFSLLMPRSKGEKGVTHSGVENFTVSPGGVKKEIFSAKTDSEGMVSKILPEFGLYYSFEFEKTDLSNENILLNDGTFEVGLNFTSDGIYANHQPTNGSLTEKLKLSNSFTPGYYRVTVGHGMAQLFCDNVIIGTFRCPMKSGRPSVFVSSVRSGEYVCLKYADDIYYHYEDFEGNNEPGFSAEDYWYSESDALTNSDLPPFYHEVISTDNENYLSLSGEGDYLLNAISDNATFKWRGRFEGNEGKVWVIFRYSDTCDYGKIAYDLSSEKWSIINASKTMVTEYDTEDSDGDGNTTEELRSYYAPDEQTVSEVLFSIDDTWHDFELVTNFDAVTLLCDGKKILEASGVRDGYGRLGFGTSGATLFADDVDYAGCGKANAGLSFMTDAEFDFYENFNGQIVMAGNYGNTQYHISDDNGVTWKKITYDGSKSIGARSGNNIRLLSGKFLRAIMSGKYTYAHLYDQETNPDTETTPSNSKGSLIEPLGTFDTVPYSCMPARLMQVQSGPYKGRVFFCRGGSDETQGRTFMFYTDDYIDPNFTGKATWHEPNVQPSYDNMGINVQESQMVDMPDGSLRYYMRTDRGSMYYLVSEDGGETWDVTDYRIENLISPLCCYSIQRVGDSSTYYAYWEYDTVTSNHIWIGMPRNRRALAVSHDGMKTWQYVADIEEDGYGPNSSKSNCNHGMRVLNGAVYMSYYNSPNLHKMYRQDISKSKPLMRFTGIHYRIPGYISANDLTDEYCAVPFGTGEAFVYGNYQSSATNENGFIDAKTFAACIGASYEKRENSHVFTVASCEAEFFDNSCEYSLNGYTHTAKEILCENGYINPKAFVRVFGKHIHMTDNAVVVSNNPLSQVLISQLEGMVIGKDGKRAFLNAFTDDVNEASKTNSPKSIAKAFETYCEFLGENNISTTDEKTFSLMTETEYGSASGILKAYASAFENANKVSEDAKNAFSSSYGKFDGFTSFGGKANEEGNTVRLKWRTGVDEGLGYRLFADVTDNFVMSFDFLREDGIGDMNIIFGNGSYEGKISLGPWNVDLVGKGFSENSFDFEMNKWYTMTVNVSEIGYASFEISDCESGDVLLCENLFLNTGVMKGISFESDCREDCTVALKSIRLYDTAFFDVTHYSVKDGIASARAEVLTSSSSSKSGQIIMAVYEGDKLVGISSANGYGSTVSPFATKEFAIEPFAYDAKDESKPSVKFFWWTGVGKLVPLGQEIEGR